MKITIKEKGFTLVEMLIVMVILIILMGIGVFGGRALINRANRISHINAVQQLNKAALQYYGDKGSLFPVLDSGATPTPAQLVEGEGAETLLQPYLEEFDGGSDAMYFYYVTDDRTKVLFCVSNGGIRLRGIDYIICEGNAFGETAVNCITEKTIEMKDDDTRDAIRTCLTTSGFTRSVWENNNWR